LVESGLFARLEEGVIDAVLAAAKPVTYEFVAKDIIWTQEDTVLGIGVVLSGTLLSYRVQPNGKPQLFQIFKAPSIMNLEAAVSRDAVSPVSVVASTNGCYLWFSSESLFKNAMIPGAVIPVLQENLLSSLASSNIRLMDKADILARRTVRGRILHSLSLMCGKRRSGVDIGMSQEEFAHYLCVDRSSLSTELNNIRRSGIIDFEGTRYRMFKDDESDQ
jgi:CRP-like cAMP-binding protein